MSIGWGIIGIGRHPDLKVVPAMKLAAETRLIAAFSRDRGRADAFARKHNFQAAYDSLQDLLRDPRIDAVYISSPNFLHAPYTKMAAEAGKHILVEKPMALNVKDALEMVHVCRHNGVKLGVGFQLRHHPGHRKARELIQEGILGLMLYGMFTCQEEIGAKGAQVVAFDPRPQMTITLDTVPTKNPDKTAPRDTDINKGPVISLFDWLPSAKLGMFTHPAIKDRMLTAAREIEIPFQVDVLTSTYLDSARAHLTAGGIPGGSICIPRRYSHSAVELGHMNDITNGIRLLIKVIEDLDKKPIEFGRVY